MLYSILKQTHPKYCPDIWSELSDLYVGGYTLIKAARRYLPSYEGENSRRYQERLQNASYINHMGQIIDFFTANLFSQDLVIKPAVDSDDPNTPGEAPAVDRYYEEFEHDADLCGKNFADLVKHIAGCALLKKRAIIAIDFPRPEILATVETRADEDKLGLTRAYAYDVHVEEMIDWEKDDFGRFQWVMLKRVITKRDTPLDRRDMMVEEFKLWTISPGGTASYQIFRTAPRKPSDRIDDQEDITLYAEGATTFKRIPLIELEIPDGLWVGNKLGPLAMEHFRRRSALVSAENKSMFAIPYAKLGPEGPAAEGAMVAEVQENPNRGRDMVGKFHAQGYVVVGAGDDIGYLEPEGKAYSLVDQQLKDLIDEMFRIVHQMAQSVSNTSKNLGRSGLSKVMDHSSTEVVLSAYGALVRDFAKEVYDLIAEARDEDIIWTAYGLDDYNMEDRDMLLKEALAISNIPIPSRTFKQEYLTRVAISLLGSSDPETLEQIRQEIVEGVDHNEAMAELMAPTSPNGPNSPASPGASNASEDQFAPPVE